MTEEVLEADAPEVLAAPVLKWVSYPGNNGMTTPAPTAQVGVISGTGSGGVAPGAIAVGDLLIVVAHAGKAGGLGDYTISGTGWNLILHPSAGDNEIKIFVWWKNADASDITAAGVYTVTWGGVSPEAFSWAEYNFGQNAFIDAWNGVWSNVVITGANAIAPACFPTGSADTLLTYWFNYHDINLWVLPGGMTTLFNAVQGGLPSTAASATKTLSAPGFTGNLVATIGTNQQYGAFQIAISTGAPPNGGGGNSPIKWLSFMATQPTVGTVSSVIVGTTAPAQTLGPFAAGDLYVVAVSVEADTGPPGALSISGSGWTNLVATAAGAPLNTRLSVWAKVVSGGETGVYTVSWPNATGNPNWVAYNLGQATLDVAAGQCLAPTGGALVAPTITTTAANEAVLAYWFLVDTGGTGIVAPTTAGFTPLAINLTTSFKWDMTTGAILAPTAGATGNMTATATAGMPVYSAFQLAYKPTTGGGGSPPPVPTGLTATAVSSSQINLSWSASTGATSYNVLRGGSTVGTPSGTTFADTGLTASTSYTYRVQAVSAGGTSASSSPASATTLAPGASPFPAFTPLLPPPLIGAGGTAAGVPVVPAGVPPSTAGKALIIFGTGSASSPTAASWFPTFTTTFPVPTVVFSNVWTVPTFAGGNWTSTLPARTATTPPLGNSYNTGGTWGLPGPSGSGPGPPTGSNPPGAGRPFLASVESDEAAPEIEPHLAAAENGATASRRRRRPSA